MTFACTGAVSGVLTWSIPGHGPAMQYVMPQKDVGDRIKDTVVAG